MTKIQTITGPDGSEMVVLSRPDYDALLEAIAFERADADAAAVHRDAMSRIRAGDEETIDGDMLDRLTSGKEHPVKIWRDHRRLSQAALAGAAGCSAQAVANIETGRSQGSFDTLTALARVLGVPVETLRPVAEFKSRKRGDATQKRTRKLNLK